MTDHTKSLSGVVLCAGRGRRMGRPKASVRLAGRSLLERAVQKLAGLCDEIIAPGLAQCRVPQGCRCVPDSPQARGPMAGVIAGLKAASSPVAVVLACDMPLVPPALLAWLAERCREGYMAAIPTTQGRLHPLCGAYSRELAAAMEQFASTGNYSLRDFLASRSGGVLVADERALTALGVSADVLLNVNSPEDLRRAESLLRA